MASWSGFSGKADTRAPATLECKCQARPGPLHLNQQASQGAGDERASAIRAAKADVCYVGVEWNADEFRRSSIGMNQRDAARLERRDTHRTALLHGEGVELLILRGSEQQLTAVRR